MAEPDEKQNRAPNQENRREPRRTKSRIPVSLKPRPALTKLPQFKTQKAMNKEDGDKPLPPKIVKDVDVTPCSRPSQRPKSQVKTVPNFKKLHIKWDKQLDEAKDSRRKAKRPTCNRPVSPLATIMDNGRLHASLKRQDAMKSLADSLFKKAAQTTGNTIRVMSRVDDNDDGIKVDSIKINLEGQLSEVADDANRQTDSSEIVCGLHIRSTLQQSHNSVVGPLMYDEVLPYYTPASFYEIDNELCTILDTQQLPCSQPCSGRENPLPWVLQRFYFLPIRS